MRVNRRNLAVKIPADVPYKRNGRDNDVAAYIREFDKLNGLKPAEYMNHAHNYWT